MYRHYFNPVLAFREKNARHSTTLRFDALKNNPMIRQENISGQMVVSMGIPNSWMVIYKGKSHLEMDDLGVSLF